MAAALDGPPSVIATGGGWAVQPGNLAAAESRALSIYLSLPAGVAAARLHGTDDRPLLGSAPLERLGELLAERERWYRLAGVEIAADRAPELVAEAVATAARRYGGW
jgi:shikimate kinase